ncbi:MaoC family dehydratase [Cohnella lupini]|uniref:MaoC dehydratase-like protein n=1 Tax=Cohnella lupini TaxID=1294267 RepID=A0A3D9I079_9BACL|nr:MaoC family dehydratase [Cohnella lupini]RED55157.1 MaoC dehydratase-like protein [Cohnella lupini]
MKKKITAEAIQQYADASNDPAAFHFDPEAAMKAGFNRPIAQGMYIMGLAHSAYLSMNPTQWIKSARMTFLSPLLSETVVRFEFETLNEEVHVTITGENDEIIASGSFSVEGGLNIE